MEALETITKKTRMAYDLAAVRYHELFHDEMSGKPHDLALIEAFASRFHESDRVLDAGCGPCAGAGRIVFGNGVPVVGVDISARCIELASAHHSGLSFAQADLADLPFRDASFHGVLSYYSIIDTPKRLVPRLLTEFRRVLVPGGCLLLVVKEGDEEGWQQALLGIRTEIYVSTFSEQDVVRLLEEVGFVVDAVETRTPYPFEIDVKRVYATARTAFRRD